MTTSVTRMPVCSTARPRARAPRRRWPRPAPGSRPPAGPAGSRGPRARPPPPGPSRCPAPGRPARAARLRGRLQRAGQQDLEGRAPARLALHLDLARRTGRRCRGRWPAPGRCPCRSRLGGEEGLEEVLPGLGRQPDARVAHGQPDPLPRAAVRTAPGRARQVRGLERERAACRHGVASVDRQVDDDLLQLARGRSAPATGPAASATRSATPSPRSAPKELLAGAHRRRSGRATPGWMTCFRAKASSCRVRLRARSAAQAISSTTSASGGRAQAWCPPSATRTQLRITVSRLLKSWATPPAS